MTARDVEPAHRVLTLEEARAIECNGCGDCCDSRRAVGGWAWGALPADQFAPLNDGEPLIIPVVEVDGQWQDRAYRPEDAFELSPTRFRCAAFEPQPDGGGRCGRHDAPRPQRCGDFPVWGAEIEAQLHEHGEVPLETAWLPRCAWYRVTVVAKNDPRRTG